ncbi:MAG: ROK family protein [Chloroflexota bacterium]
MKQQVTVTPAEMRNINRSAVSDIIRRRSPIARTQIAHDLNVSLPTVMRIVDELYEDNLIRYSGEREWSGGRRRPLIEWNSKENLAIAIDLGRRRLYGAVADLGGNVLHETTIIHTGQHGEPSYYLLVDMIRSLLGFAEKTGYHIRGIGVGVPGVTHYEEGLVEYVPGLEWRDFPLRDRLISEFSMPVVVDNDANLIALGEYWSEAQKDIKNLVVVTIGIGIGAGIIIDGGVYRGSHGSSGEVGYLLPSTAYLDGEYFKFGAFEEIASGAGIAVRAHKLLDGTWTKESLNTLDAEAVFAAARSGESWAQTVVNETVDYMAQMVVTLCVCFDPDLIILRGGVLRSADLLIDPIRERLKGRLPFKINVIESQLGPRAAVLGAITSLLHNISNRTYVVRST